MSFGESPPGILFALSAGTRSPAPLAVRFPEHLYRRSLVLQSKMFRFTERLSTTGAGRVEANRYLKRAGLFAAGLLLLWVALQLVPSEPAPAEHRTYSDEAGTVASRPELPESRLPSFISFGNLAALLLLGGGVALAVHLRKRSRHGTEAAPFKTVASYSVGPNQSIQLIECGGETHLIGITTGQISLLKTYPSDRFVSPALDAATVSDLRSSHFADVLQRYAGANGHQPNGTAR